MFIIILIMFVILLLVLTGFAVGEASMLTKISEAMNWNENDLLDRLEKREYRIHSTSSSLFPDRRKRR